MPNLKGRFLEGANTTVKQYKSAGLPNITGSVSLDYLAGMITSGTDITGVFSVGSTKYSTGSSTNSSSGAKYGLDFDASDSNSIYGNSTTVQPKSYTVNYLIKAY